jgi:hypothetical protein
MGLAKPSGRRLVVEVSRLGTIISAVTTSGLYGTTPVFAKAAKMLLSVKVWVCCHDLVRENRDLDCVLLM